VYFQMLGEHGYVGLLLFLALGVAAWFTARRLIRSASATPDSRWAGQLARSIQASLVGFAVGGAFVNIGYWEPPYYEILILLVAYKEVTTNRQAAASVPTVDIASEGSAMTSAGVRVPSDSR